VNAMAGHIRRSIDMTLLEEMKSHVYGAHQDSIDSPQYFLSGQPGASIDDMSPVDMPFVGAIFPSIVQLVREFAALPFLHPLEGRRACVGPRLVASD